MTRREWHERRRRLVEALEQKEEPTPAEREALALLRVEGS